MPIDRFAGDTSWAGKLFERDFAWLRGRLLRRTRCPHDAEDFAAETFLQLLRLPDPGAVREPRALLTTIARRVMYESWRREDLQRAYRESLAALPAENHPSAEVQYVLVETLLALDRLLDGLPGPGKAVFIHHRLGGLSYREIGREMGISVAMVHRHMARAYECCLQAMEDL